MRSLLLALLMLPLLASAQEVYTWTDKSGVVHYSDDPSEVPKGTQLKTTRGDPISKLSFPLAPNAQPQPEQTEQQPQAQDREAWSAKFREAHAKIEELKQWIAADMQVVEPNGLPVTGKYSCYAGPYNTLTGQWGPTTCGLLQPDAEFEAAKERLRQNREALKQWQSYLSDLERYASQVGIPQNWRK